MTNEFKERIVNNFEFLVSVITVVYNDVNNIEATIISVINQADINLEYIIIDGGSTDGTVDIIKKYQNHISFYVSEKDLGIYDAMNKGVTFVSGKWVSFMNSGDRFYNSSTVYDTMTLNNDPSIDILYGNTQVIYPDKQKFSKTKALSSIKFGSVFCHQSVFVNAVLLKSNLFNINNKISADFEFFYDAYKCKKKFKHLDIVVSSISAGGISDTKRVSTVIGWWKVVDRTVFIDLCFLYKILIEYTKSFIKRILL